MKRPVKARSATEATRYSIAGRVKRFLKLKRSLGFKMETEGILLNQFVQFAAHRKLAGPLKADDLTNWASGDASHTRRYQANRLSIIRSFARHCAAEDDISQVPPARLLSAGRHRKQPHIFTAPQITALIAAAGRLTPVYPNRPLVYSTLLGLLASTGMRISEAIGLTLADVDLDKHLIVVRHTKFGKSRLVPLHPTASIALQAYMRHRDPMNRACAGESMLVGANGGPLPYTTVLHTFRRLIRQLGFQSNGTITRIRIHDLRHSFACHRLHQWYREKVDVEHAIASLSTYLGHGKVTDTYWYLTGTGELLATVAKRFEQFAEGVMNDRRST
jgi:integrase